jgi:hypothetical protein
MIWIHSATQQSFFETHGKTEDALMPPVEGPVRRDGVGIPDFDEIELRSRRRAARKSSIVIQAPVQPRHSNMYCCRRHVSSRRFRSNRAGFGDASFAACNTWERDRGVARSIICTTAVSRSAIAAAGFGGRSWKSRYDASLARKPEGSRTLQRTEIIEDVAFLPFR